VSTVIIRAGIIGPIAVGIIYGAPLANILEHNWQETFLAVGYVGLILIIFEGGLTTRMDLLKQNFSLSMLAATTGVVFPIGLSYLLLHLGFGFGAVETFIIGAALSTTSLGTTFAVIGGASKSIDLSQTRVGTVLVSAAVIDDVSGLVMSSVIGELGTLETSSNVNLGWLIGRPILASLLMAVLTPVLTKYVLAPFFRRYIEYRFARYDHRSNIFLMVLVLSAFISIAAYSGTSVLFGAFLAGSFLTYLPSKHPEGPFVVLTREEGEQNDDKSPTFVHTFQLYCADVQKYLMEPLFFASIGFAIPFLDLWTGETVWKGIVYSLLMLFAKVYDFLESRAPLFDGTLTNFIHKTANRRPLDAPLEPPHNRPQSPKHLLHHHRQSIIRSPSRWRDGRSRRNRTAHRADRVQLDFLRHRYGFLHRRLGDSIEHHHRADDGRAVDQVQSREHCAESVGDARVGGP
jgi:Kef-type K+ transport system membrane component KefB